MPIKLKANNGNIDLKAPIKQVGGGAVNSVNGMTGDVVLDIPSKTSDLVNDSGFLTEHQSLAEYAKKSELFSKDYNDLTNKPTIPSIDGLASTSYVDSKVAEIDVPTKTSDLINDSGFLTEHQSLADYAKKSEIPDVSGFLTSIPDEYVTETELDAKGYLTEHQSLSEYAKKSELFSKDYNDLTNKPTIPSVEGLASTQYVDEKVATKQDTLTAGSNITIENGVISATGGSGGGSYTLPVANNNTLGGVKVIHNSILRSDDGNKVLMDDNNRLFIPYASTLGDAGLVGFNPDYFDIDGFKRLSTKKATIAKLGVVKPDGTTITIDDDGVISAAGSSGSSDTRFIVINKDVTDTLTDEEGALLYKAATNLGKYSLTFINNGNEYNNCIKIYKDDSSGRDYFIFYNTTYGNTSNNGIMRDYSSAADNKITNLKYDWQYDTTLLDTNNWSSYISVPSDWNYTSDISDSNLYNAKEIAIYWEYNNIYHCNYYNFSSNNYLGYFNGYTFCAMNDYNNGNSTWDYNGSNINTSNMNIQIIYYKT